MDFYYDQDGFPTKPNISDIINPFERYYGKEEKKDKYASRNPTLLNDYLTLVTGMFEQKCKELQEIMNAMEATGYCLHLSIMKSKYTKRRHAVYSRLNELEDLRKTMIRAQQIHQSQINKLQKENYKIRSTRKFSDLVETPERREREIILERNTRAIEHAKRCSNEITRTLANKNIDPTKKKLEAALEKFVLFSETMKGKQAELIQKGRYEL
jgi:hypothetical protein